MAGGREMEVLHRGQIQSGEFTTVYTANVAELNRSNNKSQGRKSEGDDDVGRGFWKSWVRSDEGHVVYRYLLS